MTFAEDGWVPVTPTSSRAGYTWRMWCDTRRPIVADFAEPEPWPADGEYLSVGLEAAHSDGRHMSTAAFSLRDRDEKKVIPSMSWHTGFPWFVEVRFAEDLPGIAIETDRRLIAVDAQDLEPHYGLRFFATPLDDGESFLAVIGGGTRYECRAPAKVPEETCYYPNP